MDLRSEKLNAFQRMTVHQAHSAVRRARAAAGRCRHRAMAAHDDLATKPVASDDDLESCYDDVTAACVASRCALPLDWCSSCSPVRPSSLCTP